MPLRAGRKGGTQPGDCCQIFGARGMRRPTDQSPQGREEWSGHRGMWVWPPCPGSGAPRGKGTWSSAKVPEEDMQLPRPWAPGGPEPGDTARRALSASLWAAPGAQGHSALRRSGSCTPPAGLSWCARPLETACNSVGNWHLLKTGHLWGMSYCSMPGWLMALPPHWGQSPLPRSPLSEASAQARPSSQPLGASLGLH